MSVVGVTGQAWHAARIDTARGLAIRAPALAGCFGPALLARLGMPLDIWLRPLQHLIATAARIAGGR